jgi:hypothetical protein
VDLRAHFLNSRMDLLRREQYAYRIGQGDILCFRGRVKGNASARGMPDLYERIPL